jgi:very-short-patch-repair endonuclease
VVVQNCASPIASRNLCKGFVLVDGTTTAILLVIELDDRTHQQARRRERDAFVDRALAAAGIPILHVKAASAYDARELAAVIARQMVTASKVAAGRAA